MTNSQAAVWAVGVILATVAAAFLGGWVAYRLTRHR